MRLPKEATELQHNSTMEHITPRKAEAWLATSIVNRTLTDDDIQKYAIDMEDGRWLVTGESIKFDWGGHLIDGHHRLHAVLLSGVTIQCRVDRGLDPIVRDVIDTGRSRKPADSLKMAGHTDVNNRASTINMVYGYEHHGNLMAHRKLPNRRVLELAEAYDLDDALRVGQMVNHILPKSRVAAVHYLASHSMREESEAFWRAVASGEGLKAGDPALALRNKIIDFRIRAKNLPKKESLIAMVVAWNKAAQGRSAKQIKLAGASTCDDIVGAKPRLKVVGK